MDIFFKGLVLETCSLGLSLLVVYYYDLEHAMGGIEPKAYLDAIARLIFCIVAHIMMNARIDESFERLKFVIEHPYNFRTFGLPLFLSFFHLVVNFANEYIMLSSILHEDNLLQMLGNWTAVYIISEIPGFYFFALTD